MESVIEEQRRSHEERERLTDCMVKEWLHERKAHKEKVNSEHRLKQLLDRFMARTSSLSALYEDVDNGRHQEIQALGPPNEFTEFYNRLKCIRDVHRHHPNEVAIPLELEFKQMNDLNDQEERLELDMATFTDEEGYGRYLDMNKLHEKYINLKAVPVCDYITYLTTFDQLHQVPKETKKSVEYRRYLQELSNYFRSFLERTRPLLSVDDELSKCNEQFETQWTEGTFLGWTDQDQQPGALARSGAHLDLSPFNSAIELQSLGLDRLKSALLALGLKCGGTLEQRAARLFSTKGRSLDDLDSSLFAAKAGDTAPLDAANHKQRTLAALEAQIYYMCELLSEQRNNTKDNVQRRQARTVGEQADEEMDEPVLLPEEDDDEDVPYNPKNLPLDWDGKPIPYWLYKLHGLNISYPCEICGNQVYKGPKAFQRHFSEWRHSHGMRCLGIPNTAHFANITKIADAIELWQKLREHKDTMRFKPELEEEYEDSVGNVVTKKTFDDLKRQGLL